MLDATDFNRRIVGTSSVVTARARTLAVRSKKFCQASVWDSSARSLFANTFKQGLSPRSSANMGFSLEYGIRASSTSMTTWTLGSAAWISSRALCMWPGNHWIGMSLTVDRGRGEGFSSLVSRLGFALITPGPSETSNSHGGTRAESPTAMS